MSDTDVVQVNTHYKTLYNMDLKKAISQGTPDSDWAQLLQTWVICENDKEMEPEATADHFYQAAKGFGTDVNMFVHLLCSCTGSCFKLVCEAYQKKYKKSLYKVIEKEFKGTNEFAFLLAHEFLVNPAEGVAFALKQGCREQNMMLIATTLIHSEKYIETIKMAYARLGDLQQDIAKYGKYVEIVSKMWGL
ncbi:Annexin [Hexamita inflata]|uniref:Annexin n=1 Tax=Hexamita inflata TaxID=28002 RepID=A0AA86UED7_9EUKA|nr:Annexin [Hexamita inflata]